MLNRIVIAPIKSLAIKSGEISEGNLNARVKVKKKDEIGRLGTAFNIMADSVQKTITILDEQNKQMRFELAMASAVQKSIYPEVRKTDSFDIAVHHRPFMEVSGDYHDIIPLSGNRYGILVADVSGHGVAAALITMLIRDRFTELAHKFSDPRLLLHQINVSFKDLMLEFEKYFTAFYLVIEENIKAVFSSAAHPKGFLFRKDEILPLTTKGVLIGVSQIMENAFTSKEIALEPGDKILLYTDGIIESHNVNEEEYSVERLVATSSTYARLDCEDMCRMIVADVHAFQGEAKRLDDETLIVIQIK